MALIATLTFCSIALLIGAIIYSSKLVAKQILGNLPVQMQTKPVPEKPSVIEMTPEKFRELPYRKSPTMQEAALDYEKKYEARIKEAMRQVQ